VRRGLFGAEDRLGVHYSDHGHAFTTEDWTAMMDFFDKFSLGKKLDRTFDHFPSEKELDDAAQTAAARARRSESNRPGAGKTPGACDHLNRVEIYQKDATTRVCQIVRGRGRESGPLATY
jgi:hypothetical protein